MILQGYFDDSGSDKESPVYVLAGYVAPVERWTDFIIDWQSELRSGPQRLSSLHTADGYFLYGEFKNGWTRGLIDQKLLALAEVVAKHVPLRIQCSIMRSDFDEILAPLNGDKMISDPYFLCFYNIVLKLKEYLHKLGADNASVDTFFDEQGVVGIRAVGWWDAFNDLFPKSFSNFARPIFKSDKEAIPLQAADLAAYHFRRLQVDRLNGKDPQSMMHIHRVLGSIGSFIDLRITRDDLSKIASAFFISQLAGPQ